MTSIVSAYQISLIASGHTLPQVPPPPQYPHALGPFCILLVGCAHAPHAPHTPPSVIHPTLPPPHRLASPHAILGSTPHPTLRDPPRFIPACWIRPSCCHANIPLPILRAALAWCDDLSAISPKFSVPCWCLVLPVPSVVCVAIHVLSCLTPQPSHTTKSRQFLSWLYSPFCCSASSSSLRKTSASMLLHSSI